MNINKTIITTLASMALLVSVGCNKQKGTSLEGNPFATASTLPYGAPDFSQIKDEHYLPAIKGGIEQQREEIKAIVDNKEEPTFENVIIAYERSGALLDRGGR